MLHNLHIPIIALVVSVVVVVGLVWFGTKDAIHHYCSKIKTTREPPPYEYSSVIAMMASLFFCSGVVPETLKSETNLSEVYVWVCTLSIFVGLFSWLKYEIERRAREVAPDITFT